MKYSQWIGILAAALLVGACFLPWAWYPDLRKEFTGFFSEGNAYGRPGKIFMFFAVIQTILFLFPKVWAKRANIFVSALTIAFSLKCYLLFTACYRGICPTPRIGIFLVALASITMLVATLLPGTRLKEEQP